MKSIADLRAEKFTERPERPYTAVVGKGQKYVIEIQRLTAEHDALAPELEVAAGRLADIEGRASERPRAMGEKSDPDLEEARSRVAELRARVNEIRARLREVTDLMAEYEGEIIVRATRSDGDWERWRIANPPRDEEQPGHRDDWMIARGVCNADALLDDLCTYVVAWRGEDLQAGDYEALNLVRPDKKAIARIVVGLYESGDDIPKLRSGLSALLKSENFSALPEPSESPNDDSLVGSPSSGMSTSTTTQGV